MIAGNTGPATIEMITNNIYSMVELAQVHQIKVILCSVLPANFFYWNPKEKPADQITELNAVLKEYALSNRISYVDYYSEMADEQKGLKKQLSEDGVHPNSAGYKIMSPLVEKTIQEIIYNL